MAKKKTKNDSILAENRKARYDYEILDKIEAGLVLTGPEVKSVKSGHISLKGTFVAIKGSEAFLLNAHISPYRPAAGVQTNYDPTRSRKLLMKKSEIKALFGKINEKGLTAVPLLVYTTRSGLIKISVGLGRGKKKFEKKETLKKRAVMKEIRQAIKGF